MLMPEPHPTDRIDVVIVPNGPKKGMWVRKDQPMSKRASQRLVEMIAGRKRVMEHAAADPNRTEDSLPGEIRFATEEEFAYVCGLVVVEQAERITI